MSVFTDTDFEWLEGSFHFSFSVFRFCELCKTALSLLVGDGAVEFVLGNVKCKVSNAKCKMGTGEKDSFFTYYPSPEAKYKCGWENLT